MQPRARERLEEQQREEREERRERGGEQREGLRASAGGRGGEGGTHCIFEGAELALDVHADVPEDELGDEEVARVCEGELVREQAPVLRRVSIGVSDSVGTDLVVLGDVGDELEVEVVLDVEHAGDDRRRGYAHHQACRSSASSVEQTVLLTFCHRRMLK